MKLAGCKNLVLSAETGTWVRAVDLKYWAPKVPLYTAHTKLAVTRYNPGLASPPFEQFEILYLAENDQVAAFEVNALLGSPQNPISTDTTSWVYARVSVHLQKVADLTSVAEQKKILTTAQELTGDWAGYTNRSTATSIKQPTGLAPTQDIGLTLFRDTEAEAFVAISARIPTSKILVVFPEKLKINSYLRFQDPKTRKYIPVNGKIP